MNNLYFSLWEDIRGMWINGNKSDAAGLLGDLNRKDLALVVEACLTEAETAGDMDRAVNTSDIAVLRAILRFNMQKEG
mgnify:CR=1 FL=1